MYPAYNPMLPEAISLGAKLPRREADNSPSSRADVNNGRAIPPLPMCLQGMALNSLLLLYFDKRQKIAGSIPDEVVRLFFI
jgi:hypothetical protein